MSNPRAASMADGTAADDAAYLAGKPCPKCAYARTPADAGPDWQCPRCHIAYLKFRPGAARLAARLVADRRELATEARSDRSVYTLLFANLFTGAVAVYYAVPTRDLVLVYWLQSVFIGLSFFVRILCLREYTVNRAPDSFERIPGKRGANVPAAFKFLVGYGLVHAFYLVFLWDPRSAPGASGLAVGACTLVFALNHLYSLFYNIELDSRARPNLNAMLFIPISRIMPMHVFVILGGALVAGMDEGRTFALAVVIGGKTASDVLMHVIEHHELRRHPLDG